MISVEEALAKVFALCDTLGTETVPLRKAHGRVLAEDAVAKRDQPPFASSAMDGYGVRDEDAGQDNTFEVIGEAAAGHSFDGPIGTGQAVRIFTGAPVPADVTRVIIQEDVTRDGDVITQVEKSSNGKNIRPLGGDFAVGDRITAPRKLTAQDVTLLAAMNVPEVTVSRRPEVALIATGDELVMPGETPGPSQIIASNSFGLAAMVEAAGAVARMLPIAPDTEEALLQTFELAEGADVIVTIGGASVGDHDIVGRVAIDKGLERAFYKVAMRPGKPLMAGRLDGAMMIGLPGNPVSSMVAAKLFLEPALAALQGLPHAAAPRRKALAKNDIPSNGSREHYMRARFDGDALTTFDRQDSSLMSVLSTADVLIVMPPNALAVKAGGPVEYIAL